jgi:hypothetical protein
MACKPSVHRFDAAWVRCNELFNLFLGQMLTVALVKWVADFG